MNTRKTKTIYAASTLILTVPLLILCGCATCQAYPGPERSLEEVGILSVRQMNALRIDDQPISQSNVREINLLPGTHTIAWEFTYPNLYREMKRLEFKVEQGRRYQLVQRFFSQSPVGHPLEFVFDFTIDAVVAPLIWLFPPESPTSAPEGEYFMWIVDQKTRNVLAGASPGDSIRHAAITDISMDMQ